MMFDFSDDLIKSERKQDPHSEDDIDYTSPQKPSLDKKSRTPIKTTKAGESLYNRGKEFLSTVEQKRQEIANKEHSFKPKINAKSEKMIKLATKEGRNPREKKAKAEINEEEEEEEEKKIKPKGNIKEFIERNYTLALSTKTKTPEKTSELDSECTFKPKIDEKSKELANNGHEDLFKQAESLKKRKQEKIDEALKKKRAAELDGCTFHPQLMKPVINYSPSSKLKKTVEIPTGYSKNKQSKFFINT